MQRPRQAGTIVSYPFPVTAGGRVLFLHATDVGLSVQPSVRQNSPMYFKLDISKFVSRWIVASLAKKYKLPV